MSAIYQRARPVRWEDIVGQEHVKDVLKAALEQGRVGHAYLFSGPRGVGKTTTARLIAMTANCTSSGLKPCGECESCLAVRAGSHPDVMEIDAASNNSVDDVRDLREKVSLAAMRGGKKIYILDEAHMMSRAAFNALLKTLEEPPGHVIFILATTEPEKIIPTILSRCQHYRFRRLTPEEIAGKLAGLAAKEGVTAEPEALHLMGRLADGAMRDGESLLERMLAAGSAITRSGVEDALGLPPSERVRGIAGALVLGDAGVALSSAAQLYRDGFAARTVVEGLVAAFGAALHAELGLSPEGRLEGADVPRLLKLQAALDEQGNRFARSADQQSLELALTHALLAADNGGGGAVASSAASASMPSEIAQRLNRLEKELATLRAEGGRSSAARPAAASIPDFEPAARRGPAPAHEAVARTEAASPAEVPPVQGNWADVVRQASMQLKAYLKPARMHAEAGYVSLHYEDKNKFHAKQLASHFDDVARLVLKVFGPVTFELMGPENLSRKQKLGSSGTGEPPAPPPPDPKPERAEARTVPQPQPTVPTPPAEIPDFDPLPRTATNRREVPAAAEVNELPARPIPTVPTPPPPRRSTMAAPEQRVPPVSPDDVAPAPLAKLPDADQEHVADPPAAPVDAQGGDRLPPSADQPASPPARELYVVEPITEEPDWGDIGGLVDSGAALLGSPLDDAPFAEYSAPRPQPAPRPTPAAAPAKATTAPRPPGDIRAHPLYEEVKGRFSGRVREIGKNRNYQAPAAPEQEATDDGGEEGVTSADA